MNKFKPTDTHSRIFQTDEAKIRFVKKYLRLFTDIIATEFHIICRQDGDKPMEFDMRAAFLVQPADVAEWLSVGDDLDDADLSWAHDILTTEPRWQRLSKPQVVIRPTNGSIIAGYYREGIILKKLIE
jgi:hypothetical protein